MILRAIDAPKLQSSPKPAGQMFGAKARPIWEAIDTNQKALVNAEQSWLITQPAHSALSGEIAAKLRPEVFGAYDDAIIRAIALHDAGWSGPDAELIRESRSQPIGDKGGARKREASVAVSFVGAPPEVAVKAWTDSVETALKVSGVGGFLVSEHFRSIAQFQIKSKPETAKHMARFIAQEEARQAKLRPRLRPSDAELQRMVDGLRFCDLLSLYICAGIMDSVEFPQKIQADSILGGRVDEQTIKLSPWPFLREEMFSFAALRHPRTKLVSSASFAVRITA